MNSQNSVKIYKGNESRIVFSIDLNGWEKEGWSTKPNADPASSLKTKLKEEFESKEHQNTEKRNKNIRKKMTKDEENNFEESK